MDRGERRGHDSGAGRGEGGAGWDDRHDRPEEIERDIDRTRAHLDDKVSALQDRLSLRSLSDDLVNAMSGGAGLGSKKALEGIRNHPVPAALVGLGVAWLLIDRAVSKGGREPGIIGRMAGRQVGRHGEGEWLAPGAEYTPGGAAYGAGYGGGDYGSAGEYGGEQRGPSALKKVGEKVSSAASGIRHAASGVKHTAEGLGRSVSHAGEKVKDAAQRTGERVGELAHQVRERAGDLSHKARETAQRAKEGVVDTYQSNPLVIGAAAFALGIIGGLAVPTTRAEDKLMGRASRRVKDTAKRVGEKAMEAGRQVASRGAQEIKGAMQDLKEGEGERGEVGEVGGRFAQKVAQTVQAIGEEVRTQSGELKQSLTGGKGQGGIGQGGTGQQGPFGQGSIGGSSGPQSSPGQFGPPGGQFGGGGGEQ